MGELELEYVKEAFATNWIAPLGPHVDAFEKDLEAFLQNGCHVAALSSGTAAIHLALVVLGIQPGDEVICQSMTFSASANPIAYQGATPVFVDSEESTWNMSPEFLEKAITERTRMGKKPKAIIVVHLYGMPARMDEIQQIARAYNIPIIEDAAEALGSLYKGRQVGTFGDIGILSFNGNKIITTSGGGAMVSSNEDYIKKARYLATQALDPAPHYQHSEIGYNYRMSNVCAGIGRGQMKVLPERINQRRNNFMFYKQAFSGIREILVSEEPGTDYFSNHWLTAILLGGKVTREEVRLALIADNIDCRPLWKPMHLQPVFSKAPYFGNGTCDKLFEIGLCLPSGSNLVTEDLERVVANIKQRLMINRASAVIS
jgi:dTDP-4-amino-4,6-dideoxygalactose transaminase